MTKTTTTKKMLIYATLLVVVAGAGWWISTNFTKKTINSKNTAFAEFVTAHTSGVISKTSAIKVQLTDKVAEELTKKSKLPKNLFSFSPRVKGEYKLEDQTLVFTPAKNLKSGKSYTVDFKLDKVASVSDELESFIFEFKTIKQAFDTEITEQRTVDKKTLKYQQVEGVVNTADVLTQDEVASIFTASQNKTELSIKWKTDLDGITHFFTIDSIQRLEEESIVDFTWDADKLDIESQGSNKLTIPAIGDFNFLSSKVIQSPEQYLRIQFSDPLKVKQNLAGMVTIKGISDLRYEIDENTIKVYPPERLKKIQDVEVSKNIVNILGFKLGKTEKFQAAFEEVKPAVRFTGSGSILPASDKGFILPFEAVNLKAVDVTVIRIYENNVKQFLQVNELNGEYDLKRVGKPVVRKTVNLEEFGISDFSVWNRFSIDLTKLITTEPGAIYRTEINFRKHQAIFDCENDESNDNADDTQELDIEDWNSADAEASGWDAYEQEGTQDDYDYWYDDNYYENRENPCNKAYYGKRRKVSRNILASDIGIIAKKGDNGKTRLYITDMLTVKPISGAQAEIFDFQNQLISSVETSLEGEAIFDTGDEAFFVIIKHGDQRGYLKLNDGTSLSMSRFETSGTKIQKGIKGFIYGERGVWRPGDTLFLSFILKEESEPLPENLPIVFEFKNPQGKLVKREKQSKNELGFYTFQVATHENDVTGNYGLTVSAGAAKFYKSLKVETIKPNRLKIRLKTAKDELESNQKIASEVQANWLHGAVAKGLDVVVNASLKSVKTTFPKYTDYAFDDPTKKFSGDPVQVFKGKTDDKGHVDFDMTLTADKAPGKMKAFFTTKVFEKGGNFSVDNYSLPLSTYDRYVGIKIPKGDKLRGMLLTDKNHTAEIVLVNADGTINKTKNKVKVGIYKLSWRWWWDETANDISSYSFKNSSELIKEEEVAASGGKAKFNFEIKYPDWGRYMVYATDPVTGHSSGKIVYVDWPGWAGRAQKGDSKGASMLMFTADKKTYEPGEEAKITFPTGKEGRALVSIENGTEVIESHWVKTEEGETEFSFKIRKNMTPNIYVHVTLLQTHAQTANDLPIRMYGVIPLMVENKETLINPVINMPDKIESESTVEIRVSEKDNKSMTYTLAIVDEGLLDLTRFKTPNPWDSFYAKEALGVKTWDMYDDVIGAYAGGLDRLLAIGGDANVDREKGSKMNRFKPVAIFLGPFKTSGDIKTHTIKMPKYIGSVRVMVVAGNDKAYGSAEKAVPVTKPLMVLGTLPRVLSPGEKLKLPVTVFAMEKNIKTANVNVTTSGPLNIAGKSTQTVTFSEPGDKTIEFDMEVLKKEGFAKVTISATAKGKTSSFDIDIEVRNPNRRVTEVIANVLEAGQNWATDFMLPGAVGSNNATLEISSLPPINLESRLGYLIEYPHGCVEQTTSAVFPQLYVSQLIELDEKTKKKSEKNIKAAIKKLQSFQLSNGGLGYWPNSTSVSAWGTNYAGHFLLEAKAKGYSVSKDMLKSWRKHQAKKARNWSMSNNSGDQLTQAYRLYTLALAGKPEKGAMNRMKESENLSDASIWRLAAAYSLAGKTSTAKKLIQDIDTEVASYAETGGTYGSDTRDRAMMLETLSLMNINKKAFLLLQEISKELSSDKYLSTQTTAYSLIAAASYAEKNPAKENLKFSYSINGGKVSKISAKKNMSRQELEVADIQNGKLDFTNTSGQILYARIIMEGKPETGKNVSNAEKGLKVTVNYKYPDGKKIDPSEIPQGTDFVAEVVIKNIGTTHYKEMVLAQLFPSGWEIINPRMSAIGYSSSSAPEYQDIRDDKVYTYFDINKNRTKTFRVMLNASYTGTYWLPPVYCESMYNANIMSRKSGKFVEVAGM